MMDDMPPTETNSFGIPELPERVLNTYARLWQLETWLRRMVYVELRAFVGDAWEEKLHGNPTGAKAADKRLSHMPTPENDPLSYLQLSNICRVIEDEWGLFAPYLPPQSIWKGKIEEISQIRHRVAHFRLGHHDDLARVVQLLRDLDKGFWKFCTSYNNPQPILPQSDDPVVQQFLEYDLIPWNQLQDGKWARFGSADPNAPIFMTIEVLRRPWANWSVPAAGNSGLLFDVRIHARSTRHVNYGQFLESSVSLHRHLVHLALNDFAREVRLTIPAVLGQTVIIDLLRDCLEYFRYALVGGHFDQSGAAQRLADSWPEYVLGPENPLTFLEPDMRCSFFGTS